MIQAIIIIYIIEWLLSFYFSNTWEIELQIKLFVNAILANALLIESEKRSLLLRSLLALMTIGMWSDFANYSLWQWSEQKIDLSLPSSIIFFYWFLHTIYRRYPEKIDDINHDTINILAFKPSNAFDVIKALFGFPAASICILADGYVWSFKRRTGTYEKTKYYKCWHGGHIVIDTRVKINDNIIKSLNELTGTKRFPYVKCVWTVRHVLNQLGDKYKINCIDEYIPGVYFMKILKNQKRQ